MHGVQLLLVLLFAFTVSPVDAEKTECSDPLDIRNIPAQLFEEADAVVREEQIRFEVRDERRGRLHIRRVITILNPDGRDFGKLHVPYDRFRDVGRIRGAVYDSEGNRIKRLRRREIDDYSYFSNISLFHDNRYKLAELYHDRYPYTVEYEYSVNYDGIINWPVWMPQKENTSVQYASYQVDVPTDMSVRYHMENFDMEPEFFRANDRNIYRWQIENLAFQKPEPNSPPWGHQTIIVRTSSNEFRIEGYNGSLESWEEFGKWYHTLSEGRDILPGNVKAQVRELIGDAKTDQEIINILYTHLQDYTRYVSIALGIGGWQTMTAESVAENRYGDCKALTNYLMCMLDVAGIKSYPALINSGRGAPDVIKEFPSSQFNHVILYVPLENDTLWLESTSSIFPAGYIGLGNEDRYALLIKPDGGKLIRTPAAGYMENTRKRQINIRLFANGDAEAGVQTSYSGAQHEFPLHVLNNYSGRDRDEWVRSNIPTGRYELISHSLKKGKGPDEIDLVMNLRLPGLASRAGSRLIFHPNFIGRGFNTFPEQENRKQPLRFGYSYLDTDSTVYTLPEGYQIEGLPENVEFTHEYGKYISAFTVDKESDTLTHIRQIERWTNEIEPEFYDDFRIYINKIRAAENLRVVLVSAE